jgi:glycerol-3-phosphate acyltransferase PlsY
VSFTLVIAAVTGYFFGSFPTGYLAGRLAGVDIRKLGSGNVGATNVTRTLGRKFGYPVFAVDFLKGVVAVLAAAFLARGDRVNPAYVDLCTATAAVFAVIGHSYPLWLSFDGGKGVATTLGALSALSWIVTIFICAVWYAVFRATRYVSVASIAAAIALPIAMAGMFFLKQPRSPLLLYFTLLLAALVILRHRSNLSRLFKGTEPRFDRK